MAHLIRLYISILYSTTIVPKHKSSFVTRVTKEDFSLISASIESFGVFDLDVFCQCANVFVDVMRFSVWIMRKSGYLLMNQKSSIHRICRPLSSVSKYHCCK